MPTPLFFVTACEASGDILGATIIADIKKILPQARFIGVAGPLMRKQGCEAIISQEELAIMGFVEVLKNLPKLLKARNFVKNTALRLQPDVYIGVDAPDFNFAIEKVLKQHEIKTVHVNSPTLWAWREGRIHNIKKAVDLMLTLFPFENKIYQEHQVPVKFIGHPLADKIPFEIDKDVAKKALSVAADKKLIALMPGSRKAEVEKIAPVFLAAAKMMHDQDPQLQFIVPMINERRATQFQVFAQNYQDLPLKVTIANAHEVLMASEMVLIASGTATLEALLCKVPMVIAYKADALSFWIAKKLVKIPYVGLPNILAGKFLVPELLQEAATPENIFNAYQNLNDVKKHDQLLSEFTAIHQGLKCNAAQQAAEAIVALVK